MPPAGTIRKAVFSPFRARSGQSAQESREGSGWSTLMGLGIRHCLFSQVQSVTLCSIPMPPGKLRDLQSGIFEHRSYAREIENGREVWSKIFGVPVVSLMLSSGTCDCQSVPRQCVSSSPATICCNRALFSDYRSLVEFTREFQT